MSAPAALGSLRTYRDNELAGRIALDTSATPCERELAARLDASCELSEELSEQLEFMEQELQEIREHVVACTVGPITRGRSTLELLEELIQPADEVAE